MKSRFSHVEGANSGPVEVNMKNLARFAGAVREAKAEVMEFSGNQLCAHCAELGVRLWKANIVKPNENGLSLIRMVYSAGRSLTGEPQWHLDRESV